MWEKHSLIGQQAWRAASSKVASERKEEEYQVQVVLLRDVPRFGRKGEVKGTSPGWMRHMLFPRGMAAYATPTNVKRHAVSEEARAAEVPPELVQEKHLLSMLRTLSNKWVNISRRSDTPDATAAQGTAAAAAESAPTEEEGEELIEAGTVMHGTITPFDVQLAVARQHDIHLHESLILMDTPITTFGTFKIPLNLRMLDDHQVELTIVVHNVAHIRHGKKSV